MGARSRACFKFQGLAAFGFGNKRRLSRNDAAIPSAWPYPFVPSVPVERLEFRMA